MRNPKDVIDIWVDKWERAFARFMGRLNLFIREDRRFMVLTKAIFGILGVWVTLWINRYEFGDKLFQSPELIMIIVLWVLYGVMVLFDELKRAREETVGEKLDKFGSKIDELITEIRQDRNERANNKV